jgi:iron complex outermembrane receptor protein
MNFKRQVFLLTLAPALAGPNAVWSQSVTPPAAAVSAPDTTLPAISVKARSSDTKDGLITQSRPTTVGKSPVAVQDTPFSIGVVDVQQIRETGATSIESALLYSAGVYAGRYGFDTRGDWAAVRGLAPSAYLDGLRSIYGFYNNVRPDLYTLERVEILKGPSSVLYGQADLGGIVNAVSKRPQPEAKREIELQLGSHARKQAAADLTGPLSDDGRWLYRLVALARDSGTQVDHVDDDARVLMPSVTWQPRAGTQLTAQFVHQQYKGEVSSQFLPSRGTIDPAPRGRIPSSTFVGEPGWDRYDTRKNEWTLSLDQALGSGWRIAAIARKTLSASITREHWATVGAVPSDAGNITRSIHTADRKTDVLAGDLRLEGRFALGPTRHQVGLGVDHQNAFWEEYNYTSLSTGGGTINLYEPVYGFVNNAVLTGADRPDSKILQTGVYAMDHVEWGAWVLSAALRRDRARNVTLNLGSTPNAVVRNGATTGRVGLMYRFDFGLSPYVSASEAFVPNLGTDGTPGAGQLKPTTGSQTEAGVKYLSADGKSQAALAWFDIEQKNRIVDGATPGGVEQVGATTRGWEVETRQRLGALEFTASLTKLDAVNAVTGRRLSSIAEKTASTWLQYHFDRGLRVGAGVRHVGNVTGANGRPELPSVTLFDAMVGYDLGAWDLHFSLRNLADKEYLSWCRGLNQDCGFGERRNALLTARYSF